MAVFIVKVGLKHYKLIVKDLNLKNNTTESLAQNYANTLEKIVKEYPHQWYNFYDFFKQQGVNYDDSR